MSEKDSAPVKTVPSSEYTREYFEACCQGHEEFTRSHGQLLPLRLSIPLELAGIRPGMQVIDIGCGRGEIVLHSARQAARAWGLDYAWEAIRLANRAHAKVAAEEERARIGIQQANAQQLPFASQVADVIFMLDVVEHLYPGELRNALDEAWRVLRPGGRLVVHTMPNLWYYHFGYPLYRAVQRLRGQRLPPDPRSRWAFSHVHINEQTPASLKRALRASRFQAKIWLASTQSYDYERNPFVRRAMVFLTRAWPLKMIFCNDIFAIGVK